MRIALIIKPGHPDTGVGRYNRLLKQTLRELGHQVEIVHPINPFPVRFLNWLQSWFQIDLVSFFNNYPIWARYPPADVYHLTSQNLATLMLFHRPPGKTVITVHDLIPWLSRKDPELRVYRNAIEAGFDRIAIAGLALADSLITDSLYTQDCLKSECNVERVLVTTVRLGIE